MNYIIELTSRRINRAFMSDKDFTSIMTMLSKCSFSFANEPGVHYVMKYCIDGKGSTSRISM